MDKYEKLCKDKILEFFNPLYEEKNHEVLQELNTSKFRLGHSVEEVIEYCNSLLKSKIEEATPEMTKKFIDSILNEYNEKKLNKEEMNYILTQITNENESFLDC